MEAKKQKRIDWKKGAPKMLCFGGACTAFLLLISSIIWLFDFPKIDDIPYLATMEGSIGTYTDFTDTPSDLDIIKEDALEIKAGEGLKLFAMNVSLSEGDAFVVSFDAENLSEADTDLYVDLYTPDFDSVNCQINCTLAPGDNHINNSILYGCSMHPDACELRIFTRGTAELEIRNLKIQRQAEVRQDNPLVRIAVGLAAALFVMSAFYLVVYVVVRWKKSLSHREESLSRMKSFCAGELSIYAIAVAIVSVMLIVLYHGANIEYPLSYANGDEMGVYYYAKTIMKFGSGGLVNPMAGGVSGADMFDYIVSDKFSFSILRLIGCFTSNPYLATNLLYFLNFYLIAIVGLFVFRKLGLRKSSSVIVSCLYAFSPFIQLRYAHMWLTPYYTVPLACMIAIQIVDGSIIKTADEAVPMRENRNFWTNIVLGFFCAFTGLYYAFFACAIFAAAIVIRLMNIERRSFKLRWEFCQTLFIVAVVCAVIVNIMPNLLYFTINGNNPAGELARRGRAGAEVYALKLVQLLLPRPGHRIALFRRLSELYAAHFPLVNENQTSSLGIVSSIGFIISLLFLFRKDAKKTLSHLNLSAFLIATIGGVGSIFSIVIKTPMRCYNRMSVFIMFFSLIVIGKLLDRVKGKNVYAALCAGTLLIGLYDQTGTYTPGNFSQFESDRNFIHKIESNLEEGDMVFMLPYTNWPSGGAYKKHIGFLESETIHWSYGAMQGRMEALWQETVANQDVNTMLRLLRDGGYDGIYLDIGLYSKIYGEELAEKFLNEMNNALEQPTIVSENSDLYFWNI